MPDTTPTDQQQPTVSPTGAPTLSPKLAPYFAALSGVCAVIAGASQLELGLSPKVFAWAALLSTIFALLAGLTPGLRKLSAVLLVCTLGLSAPSCATTSAAGEVSGAAMSLKATGQLFLVTGATLDAAYDAKALSELQYAPWRDFALRFRAAYAIADKVMEKAVESNDQSVQGVVKAEIDALAGELSSFQALAAQVVKPGAGPPRTSRARDDCNTCTGSLCTALACRGGGVL